MEPFETIFSLVCHQIPTRSPAAGDLTFPLCYRCAGLYGGMFGSAVVWMTGKGWGIHREITIHAILLSALLVPLMADGLANTLGIWQTPGGLRAVTGMAGGIALFQIIASTTSSSSTSSISTAILGALIVAGSLLALIHASTVAMYLGSLAMLAGLAAFLIVLVRLALVERRSSRAGLVFADE